MLLPAILGPGDPIGVIAPSRWIDEGVLNKAKLLVQEMGFRLVVRSELFARQGQFGGADRHRANEFLTMWQNDGIKAIWAARGGYGAQRIVDALSDRLTECPAKWFIGFSDSTAIHGLLSARGIISLHAPVLSTLDHTTEKDREKLKLSLLSGKQQLIETRVHPLNRSGMAEGRLIGGNLSVLQSMLGTSSLVIEEGDVLFIEDVDEMLYHLDRMMLHLDRSGVLQKISALCVGGLTGMRDNTSKFGFSADNPYGSSAEQIIADRVREYGFPVLFNLPCGHGSRNVPLLLGSTIRLRVTEKVGELRGLV